VRVLLALLLALSACLSESETEDMSFTDLAPLVTATYDATILVPDNGEVLTEVAQREPLQNLANRIEFVRGRVPDASATPETVFTVREDFLSYILVSSGDFVSNHAWAVDFAGAVTASQSSGTAKNPGNHNVLMPGDSNTNEYYYFLGGPVNAPVVSASDLDHATIVAQVALDGGVAAQFAWGFAQDGNALNGGTTALSLLYLTSSANWQILKRTASVSTITDSGVPVVIGEYVTCRFLKVPATGDIDVEIDGVIVHTIAFAALTNVPMTFGGRFITSPADAAPAIATTDFMFFTANSGVRSGP
jgi:hypothetical protein